MSRDVITQWQQLLDQASAAHQRVDGHPLQVFFGSDQLGRPILFFITDEKPALPRLSKAVAVERRQRESDEKWTLLLVLTDDDLRRPFMRFCSEVIRDSASADCESVALSAVYRTLAQWQSLLRLVGSRVASKEQLRGLFAELWFARSGEIASIRESVDAWTGPYGAPQDFKFVNGAAFEIKAAYPEARHVDVSSVEQLEPADVASLTLCVVSVDEVSAEEAPSGYETVSTLIRAVRESLVGTGNDAGALDHRISSLDFDPVGAGSDDLAFGVTGVRMYDVRDGFPRVRRQDVPDGVEGVRYQLRLSSLGAFQTEGPHLDRD